MENTVIEITAGNDGIECRDCARIIHEMYLKWIKRHGFRYDIVRIEGEDDIGMVHKIVLDIIGDNVYEYLKNESGIHRLARISPFDPKKRRHTSFVMVAVYQRGVVVRSYIFSPYKQVKTHKNDFVCDDLDGVLNGELEKILGDIDTG